MTFAEAAATPARLASWNFRFLGVAAAGDIMHAEFVLCHTVGTAYSEASSHSLLRVDAVCAMRVYSVDYGTYLTNVKC